MLCCNPLRPQHLSPGDSHQCCPLPSACSCGASSTSGPPAAQPACCKTCQRRWVQHSSSTLAVQKHAMQVAACIARSLLAQRFILAVFPRLANDCCVSLLLLQPPLASAVSAWEALNIQIGAVVGDTHFGSLVGMGSSGSSGGVQLWASVGLRSKRSQQEQRAALSVAPGHVAATPAGPVEDEPLKARGSASSSRGSNVAGSVYSEPHADWPAEACLHGGRPADAGQPQTVAHAGDRQAAGSMPALEQQPSVAAGCVGSSGREEAGGSREAAGGSGEAAGGSSKRGSTWDSPSEVPCSPQPGWANLGPASAAGEAAAAAADFMHPAHWAAARQAAAAAAVAVAGGAADAAPAHSTSSSSVAGSSSSVHSFLLPGACYSSSQTSIEAGELAAFAAGFAAGEAFSGAAGDSSAAERQQRQAGVVLTAAALAAAEQPVSEAAAAPAEIGRAHV